MLFNVKRTKSPVPIKLTPGRLLDSLGIGVSYRIEVSFFFPNAKNSPTKSDKKRATKHPRTLVNERTCGTSFVWKERGQRKAVGANFQLVHRYFLFFFFFFFHDDHNNRLVSHLSGQRTMAKAVVYASATLLFSLARVTGFVSERWTRFIVPRETETWP